MKISGFIAAGLPSIRQHLNIIFKLYPEYYSEKNLNNFLLKNCNKFLTSIGTDLERNKEDNSAVFRRFQKRFNRFKNTGFLKDCDMLIDSAGYQFQCGYILKKAVPDFIKGYHDFLIDNYGKYSQAFLFDPIPGSTLSIVDSYEEMKSLNILSYQNAADLPIHIKKNIIYIHHCRTPSMNKLFKELLFEYDLAKDYEYFSTGGLVSFQTGSRCVIPCNMYVVPLVDIIIYLKKRNIRKLRFHVLGDSNWKSIFFHKMVERHIKEIHNIDITITYDSTSIQKVFMLSRQLFVPDFKTRSILNMDLRSDSLHKFWKNNCTFEDCYYRLMNEMCEEYGFKKLDRETYPIYINNGKIIHKITYALAILFILRMFTICNEWCEYFVDRLYPLYKNQQYIDFDRGVNRVLSKFNNDKCSNMINGKTSAMYNSLKILEKLDIDYCNYLVLKYMSVDEAESLKNHKEDIF